MRSIYREGTISDHQVDVVIRHPKVIDLGRNDDEQRRVDAFARDLARWLVGIPRSELGPLARVVTVVAQREFRDTRALCRDRPLLAVEAAARATAILWPLLRGPLEEEEEDPPEQEEEEEQEQPAAGGGIAPDEAESEEEEEEEGQSNAEDLIKALAEIDAVDDPELESLIQQLQDKMGDGADPVDLGAEAADMLEGAAEAATEGALQTDRVARYLEHFVPGIGWSNAPGQLEIVLLERLRGLTALLEQLDDLRKLADHLGRLEDATRKKGPQYGGREEVTGVRFSGDVANALPSELGLLGDPDTEDLFYQRYSEKRLLSLELKGTGDDGTTMGDKRGPIIACIDTSASMEGAPELAAKALVLAVCRKVIPKGRRVHLILFGGPGERTEIRLRRGLGGLEGLLDFLEMSFHSGTDFDGPLLRALDLLEEADLTAADILVVTDGLCRAAPEVVDRVAQARETRGVRVWSVVLGRRDVRGVAPFSDEVWQLDPTDAAAAVGLVQKIGRHRW
jgi:uncharacterized protein with von Willebrand factor type A (vWA) domain